MYPQGKDLIGKWAGFIIHKGGLTPLMVEIGGIQADDSLSGTYSFPPGSVEVGGEFTADLFGHLLYVRLSDPKHGKLHFHLDVSGEESPGMMHGALHSAKHQVPHATITVFPSSVFPDIVPAFGAWQDFLKEGL